MVPGDGRMNLRVAVLRAGVLVLWTGFFVWLTISGEVDRYVGSRTRWVVFLGIFAVGWAAILQMRALLRDEVPARADRREWIGSLSLVAPIAIVLLVPDPGLGADAASRKSFGGSSAITGFVPQPDPNGEISFPEIVYASRSSGYARSIGITEGYEVELIGFVTHPSDLDAGFALTRFESFCCAADAVPYSVSVDPGALGDRPTDSWLRVTGELVYRDGGYVLIASDLEEIEEPKDPYI